MQERSRADIEYDRVSEAIDWRVEAAVHAHKGAAVPVLVDYAAYKTDDDDVPIDNLDQIAAPGRVRLIGHPDEFYGGKSSREYRSPVLENPTWLEVAVRADDMIRETNDHHHVFFEGLEKLPKAQQTEEGVTLYEFVMGS